MSFWLCLFLPVFIFGCIPFHWNIQFRYCKHCTLSLSVRYLFLRFHHTFTITDETLFTFIHTFRKSEEKFFKKAVSFDRQKYIAKHLLYTYSFQVNIFFAWKNPYHLALLNGILSALKYTLLPPPVQKKFLFYQQFHPDETQLQINTTLSFSLAKIIGSMVSLFLHKYLSNLRRSFYGRTSHQSVNGKSNGKYKKNGSCKHCRR